MPSHCRTIETSMWGDESFIALSSDEKLVFIYSITNETSDWSGIYRLSLALAEECIGITRTRVRKALEGLESAGLVHYTDSSSVIWVTNMWRKQVRARPSSRQVDGVIKHLGMLADSPSKRAFVEYYHRLGYLEGYPIETLCNGSPMGRETLEKIEKREEEKREEEKSDPVAKRAPSKRVENARVVCRLIAEARRKLGIESREREPGTAAVAQANKPIEKGATLDDWRSVIERAAASNRGDAHSARKYLTLSTLHRPDNFARMLERDDLDAKASGGNWWER